MSKSIFFFFSGFETDFLHIYSSRNIVFTAENNTVKCMTLYLSN